MKLLKRRQKSVERLWRHLCQRRRQPRAFSGLFFELIQGRRGLEPCLLKRVSSFPQLGLDCGVCLVLLLHSGLGIDPCRLGLHASFFDPISIGFDRADPFHFSRVIRAKFFELASRNVKRPNELFVLARPTLKGCLHGLDGRFCALVGVVHEGLRVRGYRFPQSLDHFPDVFVVFDAGLFGNRRFD